MLYFLHIPKVGGSSLARLLEDAFPAGTACPHRHVEDLAACPPAEVAAHELLAGHHGVLPLSWPEPPRTVITLLRDPVRRARSHHRSLPAGGLSYREFLAHPVYGWAARDYQARWLAIEPEPGERRWGQAPGAALPASVQRLQALDGEALAARASATLDACALVGTTERIDDFVVALARMLGRPLPPAPHLNVGPGAPAEPDAAADAVVRERSAIDARLHARADAALDAALATLPPLPPEPVVPGPYRQSMEEPLCGVGWHARHRTAEVGWHRWTGPSATSWVRLPVRLRGRAGLEVAIPSTSCDEAVASLRLTVQGRPVAHVVEPRAEGVAAVAEVELDSSRPLVLALDTAVTRPLVDPATGQASEPAGVAVGDIAVTPAAA